RTTNTAHSIRLGLVGMNGKVLYLDGDLVIDPDSMRCFVDAADHVPLLVGVSRARSSQAEFVSTNDDQAMQPKAVDACHRSPITSWEGANVFAGSPGMLIEGTRYVYECIEPYLPATACVLDLHEVDTPEDLEQAKTWMQDGRE